MGCVDRVPMHVCTPVRECQYEEGGPWARPGGREGVMERDKESEGELVVFV